MPNRGIQRSIVELTCFSFFVFLEIRRWIQPCKIWLCRLSLCSVCCLLSFGSQINNFYSVARRIAFDDPQVLTYVRIGYATVQLVILATYYYVSLTVRIYSPISSHSHPLKGQAQERQYRPQIWSVSPSFFLVLFANPFLVEAQNPMVCPHHDRSFSTHSPQVSWPGKARHHYRPRLRPCRSF